jgi:signal transduction histidine kinase
MIARAAPAVLIVEDEGIVARDLQQSLSGLGYDAFGIAASAEEAVALAAAKRPDIVLMDIRIKGPRDGIETAALLKERFPVGIIYLTAHADVAMIDRAKQTEPDGYLVKPVKVEELRSMIEITLHRRELERELRTSHQQVRDSAQRLERVREEERRAVALLLHDGIAQDLFAMKLGLEQLGGLLRRPVKFRRLCKEITLAVVKCMEAIRRVANDLRPVALAYCPVASVITEHARRFGERAHLEVKVTEGTEFPPLDEPTQLLFFRTVQEALTNVARHAQATTVEIVLLSDDERIAMRISDDGVGIVEGELRKPGSLGLLGIRERFTALGGGLRVERGQSGGTAITVHLPRRLDDAAHAA